MSDFASMYMGLPYTYTSNPAYIAGLQSILNTPQTEKLGNKNVKASDLNSSASGAVDTYLTTPQQTEQLQQVEQVQIAPNPKGCTDGADDGKISFGEKAKNFGKGVLNFFKGMVCDENGFSITRTLKTVAIAAGAVALTVVTGGAAAPYLVAAGVAMGAFEAGKGAIKAATATTDAEAKLAWQSIGSGTTAIVGSVAGAKGALKAAGKPVPVGKFSNLKATWNCLETAGKGTTGGIKSAVMHPIKSYGNVKTYWNETVKPNWNKSFSYKSAQKNINDAMEADVKSVKKQMTEIQQELKKTDLKPSQRERLHEQLGKLEDKYDNLIERQNMASATHTEPKYKSEVKAQADARKLEIQNIKEQLKSKTLSEDAKVSLKQQLQQLEARNRALLTQERIEIAQYNIQKANAHIEKLKLDLKKAGITDAEKQSINSRIELIESAVSNDKQLLRNHNMMIAAKNTLPDVGAGAGSYYLASNAMTDDLGREINTYTELEAYNQYAEQLLQQQAVQQLELQKQQYAQFLKEQAAQSQQAQQTKSYASSPYPSMLTMPQISGLDFNSLYKSPYPELIY